MKHKPTGPAGGDAYRQPSEELRRRLVGIAELAVSANPNETLITYALGSCVGVTTFDPIAGVAGLLHVMLPQASLSPEKAESNPFMFADTGLVQLFFQCYALGAKKERMTVCAAGGASFVAAEGDLAIGQRNITMVRKVLWKNGVLLARHDFGGLDARTLSIDVGSGVVSLSGAGGVSTLHEGRQS